MRADVDHALGLMHHMMYTQARAEFDAITQADPDCAMAHWGIATTLFQPLWGTTPSAADISQGRQSVQSARKAADNERERLLIDATAAFFEPDTDQLRERLAGWIADVLKAPEDASVQERVRREVAEVAQAFPIYGAAAADGRAGAALS